MKNAREKINKIAISGLNDLRNSQNIGCSQICVGSQKKPSERMRVKHSGAAIQYSYIDQCMGATAIGLYCKLRIMYEEMVPIVSFTKHGRANPTVKYCILLYFI